MEVQVTKKDKLSFSNPDFGRNHSENRLTEFHLRGGQCTCVSTLKAILSADPIFTFVDNRLVDVTFTDQYLFYH